MFQYLKDAGYNFLINGFHVKKEHVFEAMQSAQSGPVEEGNVGGGTGMVAHGFKGGTGTSSRKIDAKFGGYTIGVLVQASDTADRACCLSHVGRVCEVDQFQDAMKRFALFRWGPFAGNQCDIIRAQQRGRDRTVAFVMCVVSESA